MRVVTNNCAWLIVLSFAGSHAAAQWTVEQTDRGVTVKLDGKLVTEYLIRSGAKPILWPLVGPAGQPLTRAYPLEEIAAEEHDHPHQRSCWFTHGQVNGIDFWGELPGHGTIEHQKFEAVEGGDRARIVSHNHWLAPDGTKQCEDDRRLLLRTDGGRRLIDFDITLRATDGPVVFGDTKEGSFGVRMASSIRVDSKQGGRIVNSCGQENAGAWGKPAPWVDYHGPVDGQKAGIAILNHPTSFRFPTYWHVRTYGLFAANPFGIHDFSGSDGGAYTLPAGDSLSLRYRIVLHAGDELEGAIAEAYKAYAEEQ
jgi:hypothetical protein